MISKLKDLVMKTFIVKALEPHTLTWWRNRRTKIEINPPFQRHGRLWSTTDKAFLIDSILNAYDVPKIYVADFTWGESDLNEKKLQYAIIDGKQRFEAIFDFFDGRLVLNNDFVFLDDPTIKLGGLGYPDLKQRYPQVAEAFDEYNLSVMGVFAKTEEPIKELFVRLNRSKPLTGAEIRNAMAGPAPEVIRLVANHELFRAYVSFTVKRRQDLNAAAKILYFEYSSSLKETKKKSLDEFTATSAKNREGLELAARKTIDVLDNMSEIFLPRDELLGSAGVFPVYYWLVRTIPEADFPYVREFLVRFEEERRANRHLAADAPNVDSELQNYDRLNRSTDDVRSHEGRFEILLRRFRQLRGIPPTRKAR